MSKSSVSSVPNLIKSQRGVYKSFPSLSPTDEVLYHYDALENLEVVEDICADAHKGFVKWSSRPFAERAEILRNAAKIVERNKQEYLDAHMAIGCGRTFAEFISEASPQNILEHALQVSQPEGEMLRSQESPLALYAKCPIGPVLSIAPWNAPTVLWARAIAAPLAAGCSVIAKASEKCPITSYLLARDFHEAGVDPEALQVVSFAPQDQAEGTTKLIENKHVKKITFTGSTNLGAHIASVAGRVLKPVLLELGGKNVSIVTGEADLHKAADSALMSAWLHSGQICMSLDNCYVHSSVYDKFLEILLEKAKQYPLEGTPLRDVAGAQKVNELVSEALGKGATLAFQVASPSNNAFYPETILTNVDKTMRISTEESFGPVFSVFKYDNIEDVIEEVNDFQGALKASIWSKDIVGAIGHAKKLYYGGVHINSNTVHDEATNPHGGVGRSGTGRFNSKWGVDEFTYGKVITAN